MALVFKMIGLFPWFMVCFHFPSAFNSLPVLPPCLRRRSCGVSDGYFIGEINFDVVCYRSE